MEGMLTGITYSTVGLFAAGAIVIGAKFAGFGVKQVMALFGR